MTVCTALMDHFFGLADLAQIRRLELRQKCASVLHLASLGTLVHSNWQRSCYSSRYPFRFVVPILLGVYGTWKPWH